MNIRSRTTPDWSVLSSITTHWAPIGQLQGPGEYQWLKSRHEDWEDGEANIKMIMKCFLFIIVTLSGCTRTAYTCVNISAGV